MCWRHSHSSRNQCASGHLPVIFHFCSKHKTIQVFLEMNVTSSVILRNALRTARARARPRPGKNGTTVLSLDSPITAKKKTTQSASFIVELSKTLLPGSGLMETYHLIHTSWLFKNQNKNKWKSLDSGFFVVCFCFFSLLCLSRKKKKKGVSGMFCHPSSWLTSPSRPSRHNPSLWTVSEG